MQHKQANARPWLDISGLLLAGFINTFLAAIDAAFVVGPGTAAVQPDPLLRAAWIAENSVRWQAGWLFWFAVTLSFSWIYFALGRHLNRKTPWVQLAIGLAVIAAAVDIVGVVVNLVVLPDVAGALVAAADAPTLALETLFGSMERLAYALTNVTAFGLYSAAGLLLLPALIATRRYPSWLVALGALEWGVAGVATLLLVVSPGIATVPLLCSFALFAPWVWGSAVWLFRERGAAPLDG